MINRVVLVGRITKDPELRKTQTGKSVASFTVACNRRTSAGQQEQADFIRCTTWERTADFVGQYVRKGSLIGVEGRITTGSYDGADGKKVYTTEVTCDSVQLLESKGAGENRSQNTTAPSKGQSNGYYPDNNTAEEDFNTGPLLDISSDDLPF
ncbi:MAG: single-stranded DNA-binding protein [Erysipelotrichaceae bacterium]